MDSVGTEETGLEHIYSRTISMLYIEVWLNCEPYSLVTVCFTCVVLFFFVNIITLHALQYFCVPGEHKPCYASLKFLLYSPFSLLNVMCSCTFLPVIITYENTKYSVQILLFQECSIINESGKMIPHLFHHLFIINKCDKL